MTNPTIDQARRHYFSTLAAQRAAERTAAALRKSNETAEETLARLTEAERIARECGA